LLKVACRGPGVSRTRNLSVTSPILNHYTTAPTTAKQMICQNRLYFNTEYHDSKQISLNNLYDKVTTDTFNS